MKVEITHETYGVISYEESFWTGKKVLFVGGMMATKAGKNVYRLSDGQTVVIKGSFAFGCKLIIGSDVITLTSAPSWYEYVLALLPFVLVMVWGNSITLCSILPVAGGAIGGSVAGVGFALSLLSQRAVKPVWAKLLIGFGFLAAVFGVCSAIGVALVASLTA